MQLYCSIYPQTAYPKPSHLSNPLHHNLEGVFYHLRLKKFELQQVRWVYQKQINYNILTPCKQITPTTTHTYHSSPTLTPRSGGPSHQQSQCGPPGPPVDQQLRSGQVSQPWSQEQAPTGVTNHKVNRVI